jgi:hypothetical protein
MARDTNESALHAQNVRHALNETINDKATLS